MLQSPTTEPPFSRKCKFFTLLLEWCAFVRCTRAFLYLTVSHTPTQLVELSKAQDIEAGDGTTSVVVIAGSLLSACQKLLARGIHPTTISESFQLAADKAVEVLNGMSIPVTLSDRDSLLKSATTALNSKVCRMSMYC